MHFCGLTTVDARGSAIAVFWHTCLKFDKVIANAFALVRGGVCTDTR